MARNDRDHQFNFAMGVLDGAFFGLAVGVASYVTVLPLFVYSLTDSAVLVGAIGAIRVAGWQFPQVLTVGRVSRLTRYKPMVLTMTTFERLPFLGLAIVALAVPVLGQRAALALTFALLIAHGLCGGFTATAWQAMIGKIMPVSLRGRFFGAQVAASSVLGSVGAVVAGVLLVRLGTPLNFAACFFLAFLATGVSWLFLSRIREPHAPPAGGAVDTRALWAKLLGILRRDPNFRWFLTARALSQLGVMAIAFLTVYSVDRFAIGAATAGALTAAMTLSQAGGSLLAGWVGDHHGHRAAMGFGTLALAAAALLAILAPAAAWMFPVFALAGAGNAAVWTSPLAMTLEFGSDASRPAYIGLANTLVAPATLAAPLLGGWVVDASGYHAAFSLAALGGLLTVAVLAVRVRDPARPALERLTSSSV